MSASSAYFSRELAYLSKAQDELRQAGCLGNMDMIEKCEECAAVASDSLLKFQKAWKYQTSIYDARVSFTNSIRTIFGDHDPDKGGGFSRVGVIPLFVIVSISIAVCVLFYKVYKALKQGRGKDVPGLLLTILPLIAAATFFSALSWTYGIFARYERDAMDASLKHDSSTKTIDPVPIGENQDPGALSSDAETVGGGVFHNPAFGRIWQACNTVALRQIYNCTHGLAAGAGIDEKNAKAVCGLNGRVTGLNDDWKTLGNGLNTLISTNLYDFHAPAVLTNITRGVSYIKRLLAHQTAQRRALSVDEGRVIIMNEVVPIFECATCRPSGAEDWPARKAEFVRGMESEYIPALTSILLRNWPNLSLALYLEDVDAALAIFYGSGNSATGGQNFYTTMLREHVRSAFTRAAAAASNLLEKNVDERFASSTEFAYKNWPAIESNSALLKTVTANLYSDISRFVTTVVENQRARTTDLVTEIKQLYIDVVITIVVLCFLAFLVYMFGIRSKGIVAEAFRGSVTSSESWYARMDVAKYFLAALTGALISLTILAVIKKKLKATAEHNGSTTFYNTQKLREAAWGLMQSVGPFDCKCVDPCADPAVSTACHLRYGGRVKYIGPASTPASNKCSAQSTCTAAGAETKSSADGLANTSNQYDCPTAKAPPLSGPCSSERRAHRFYTSALRIIYAYEQCNLVTKTSRVPFPAAEAVIYILFIAVCAGTLFYIFTITMPFQRVVETRTLMRLRDKIASVAGAGIPQSVAEELRYWTECAPDGVELMRILSFVIVVVVFCLGFVLIIQLIRSVSDYKNSLGAMAMDMCV